MPSDPVCSHPGRRIGDASGPGTHQVGAGRSTGRRRRTVPLGLLALVIATLLSACGADGAATPSRTSARQTVRGPVGYVTLERAGTVAEVSLTAGRTVASIRVGIGPNPVAITPDGALVLAGNTGRGRQPQRTVSVIKRVSGSVRSTVTTGLAPAGIAVTPHGHVAWVANALSGTLTPLNTTTDAVGRAFHIGGSPKPLVVSADGGTAFVADDPGTTVRRVDLASGKVTGSTNVAYQPCGIGLAPDGRTLYASTLGPGGMSGPGRLAVIDTATWQLTQSVLVGPSPAAVLADPVNGLVYVTTATGARQVGHVEAIEMGPGTPRVVRQVAVGRDPWDLELVGRTLWVVDSVSNDVRPVDLASFAVGRAIVVGGHPHAMAVAGSAPGGGTR